MFEIQSSELAADKSKTTAITDFAQMMIKDHTESTEKLKAAAAEAKVEVPTEMLPKHKEQLDSLKGLSGADFVAGYAKAQVAAHEEAVALMEGYANNGDSEPLKKHAADMVPVIKQHYEHAKTLPGGK